MKIKDKDFFILFKEDVIRKRILELAMEINRDYEKKQPIFISVLNGAFIFAADLLREISLPSTVSFIKLSSYSDTTRSGPIKELIGLNEKLFKKDVIIIEDIVDSGYTLEHVINQLTALGPSSLEVVALLVKSDAMKAPVNIRYTGFRISNNFVIGYGLDYNGLGRNLKDIYFLKK
ncbi:MAG TPA: hypoxanthine phosphoribosyltransferase [Cyclobacteriaceae bacterium]|nr:hypoxanthine phosphoribosyltransferase [Cyclobacteriaceae bacterium]